MVTTSNISNYKHRVLLVKRSLTLPLKTWPQLRLGIREKWGNQNRQLAI